MRRSSPAVETLSAIARLMAERTTPSWTTVPHFFAVREIEADALVKAREKLAPAVSHTDILIALVARTLVRHPRLNASWSAEGIRPNAAVNLAIRHRRQRRCDRAGDSRCALHHPQRYLGAAARPDRACPSREPASRRPGRWHLHD